MVKHVVIFKYKQGASRGSVMQAVEAFRSLKGQVPGILSFEQGENISAEGKDLGFHHVFSLTFADRAARDAYLPHPAHARFVDLLGSMNIVDDVIVVDFEPQE